MATENENNVNEDVKQVDEDQKKADDELLERLATERAEERLKPIKEKLDKAFEQRDEALARLAEREKADREKELKRLEEEGKHREAYELRLAEEQSKTAEERARREAMERQNIELTRDIDVRNALSPYAFRNENASEMAFKEIVVQLVKNEAGKWVHRSGLSVKEFVKSFIDSPDNSFLLKPKLNSGSGSDNDTTSAPLTKEVKSIFDLSQAEVLKLAQEGKLPKRS